MDRSLPLNGTRDPVRCTGSDVTEVTGYLDTLLFQEPGV